MKIDKYMDVLAGYPTFIFQDFKNYLRTELGLVENDIRLILED